MNFFEGERDSEDNFDDLDDVGRPSRRVHLDGARGLEVLNEDQENHVMSRSSRRRRRRRKKKKKAKANEP